MVHITIGNFLEANGVGVFPNINWSFTFFSNNATNSVNLWGKLHGFTENTHFPHAQFRLQFIKNVLAEPFNRYLERSQQREVEGGWDCFTHDERDQNDSSIVS